jgi:hypothetical protein
MEFFTKEDGYPMSISIETMSVDKMDDDTCLYESIVMDLETNKVIYEFCHDSLLGRRKWAEGFFAGFKIRQKKITDEMEYKLAEFYMNDDVCIANVCDEILDKAGGLLGRVRIKAQILAKAKQTTDEMNRLKIILDRDGLY